MSGQTTTDNLPQIDLDALDQQTMIAVTILRDMYQSALAREARLAKLVTTCDAGDTGRRVTMADEREPMSAAWLAELRVELDKRCKAPGCLCLAAEARALLAEVDRLRAVLVPHHAETPHPDTVRLDTLAVLVACGQVHGECPAFGDNERACWAVDEVGRIIGQGADFRALADALAGEPQQEVTSDDAT